MGAWTELQTPPGWPLYLAATATGLCCVQWKGDARSFLEELQQTWPGSEWVADPANPVLEQATRELAAYFQGRLYRFSTPLDLRGTAFQLQVWHALLEIPYGETRSYREVANRIGRPGAARAVGAANRANPVPLFVPCHRVVESGGGLGGYSAGREIKRFLLALEATHRPASWPGVVGAW